MGAQDNFTCVLLLPGKNCGNIFYYFTRREYNKLTNTDKGIDTPKKLPLKFGIGGATIALFPVCQPFATGYQATACLTEKVAGDESLITLGGETAFCFRGLEEKLSFFFSCHSSTCNVVAILPLQYQMDHSTSENTQQLTRQRIDQQRVVSSQGQPSTQQGVQESSTTNPLDQLHSSNKHQQVDSGEQIVAHFEQPSTSQDMQKRLAATLASQDQASTSQQQQKRSKPETCVVSSILQLCTERQVVVFEGDVLVVYGPAFNKNSSPQTKVDIAHADLVDSYGQMTITINMNNKQVNNFLPQFFPGASVRISNFLIKNKTQYERGDADCCLALTSKSSVESIEKVCKQRRLTPDTTISQLVQSNSSYPVGTFGAVITAHHQTTNQYELHVKDGDLQNDVATVVIPSIHTDLYTALQQMLTSARTPLLLFKNVVRSGSTGTRVIRSTTSTFIDELNDECTKDFLKTLACSNLQVTGILKPKNVHLTPYQPFCSVCQQAVLLGENFKENSAHCIGCATTTKFTYQHLLQCVVQKTDGVVDCYLQKELLQESFPELAAIPFDRYRQDISKIVFLLRRFQIWQPVISMNQQQT